MKRRITAGLLAALTLCSLGCGAREQIAPAEETVEKPAYHNSWDTDSAAYTLMTEYITVDAQVYAVRTYFEEYASNRYVSLRDMALAMAGSRAPFAVAIETVEKRLTVAVQRGTAYAAPEDWREDREPQFSQGLARFNPMRVDGREVRYATALVAVAKNEYDAYLSLTDLAMILDVALTVEGDRVSIDTAAPFALTLEELDGDGFFENINGLVLGNAATGEVWFDHHGDADYPIGSTTKLMTFLLAAEALHAGTIHLSDRAAVSARGEDISRGIDGVLQVKAGDTLTVEELLYAMLVCSSNECTLTLAEHIAGSEPDFVVMMQDKAAELGLTSAVFYNCHGLPVYTKSAAPAKRQNRLSARDMFTLAAHLLKEYPEITSYTTVKEIDLPSLDQKAQTTNMVLYNVDGVMGLKTGTTNKAGCCLVTAVEHGEEPLVIVMLGAESAVERVRKTEVLARCLPQWAEEWSEEKQEAA